MGLVQLLQPPWVLLDPIKRCQFLRITRVSDQASETTTRSARAMTEMVNINRVLASTITKIARATKLTSQMVLLSNLGSNLIQRGHYLDGELVSVP